MPDVFDRRTAPHVDSPVPDPAFVARPRLVRLRDALTGAAKRLRPSRWNEPVAFFFDPKRQAELEAARPEPFDRFAELAALVSAEMRVLMASREVRRVARAVDGLGAAALALALHCPAAKDLADLLAVPDDEVFLALAPADRVGVRLHLRGAADVAQLYRVLAPVLTRAPFQLFAPSALRADGTLSDGFAGCAHWLWPAQPLARVPRFGGERVVLVGPAVVHPTLDIEPRFPALAAESDVIQTLNAFQTADFLSRLCGRPVPVQAPAAAAVSRAA
jgi:hypothetical protein